MYGENQVNDYHLLKYSLLYEFFINFSSIKIFGLPLASCLAWQFLLPHIQPFVDKSLGKQKLIGELRKQHKFRTMGDINARLIALENISTKPIQKNKDSILLSEDYYSFAIDQLKEYQVTIYGYHNNKLNNQPSCFNNYIFKDELVKVDNQLVNYHQSLMKRLVDHKLKSLSSHYYFGTSIFQKWISKACVAIIRWVYILDQLILNTRPSVIINPSEASVFGTILGLLSKKYQIPFINMPILLIGDQALIPSRADYYFVWGRNQKNWLLDRLINEGKIVETGNVKFYYEMKNSIGKSVPYFERLNIPNNHHIIGYTTQPFPNTNDKIEKWIAAVPNNLPVTILVKKHRVDQYEYPVLLRKKNIKILPSDFPLYEFLNHLDCLMTISSNTAIEAALLNKPLLILQPDIPYHYKLSHNQLNAHLSKAQAGETITNSNELSQAITRIIGDVKYVNLLKKQGNKFLSETLATLNDAPSLARKKIEEIIKNH